MISTQTNQPIADINPCNHRYSNSEFDLTRINDQMGHASLTDSCCECPLYHEQSDDNMSCTLMEPFYASSDDGSGNLVCGVNHALAHDPSSLDHNPSYATDVVNNITSDPGMISCLPVTGECSGNYDDSSNYTCPLRKQTTEPCYENTTSATCGGNCVWNILRQQNDIYHLDEIGVCRRDTSSTTDTTTCCVDRDNYCFNSNDGSGNTLPAYGGCDNSAKFILTSDSTSIIGANDDISKANCCVGAQNECSGNLDDTEDILNFNETNTNPNMCLSGYEVLDPCYLTQDETICNDLNYQGRCSDPTYNDDTTCANNGGLWTPEQQRCEYRNENCYPIGTISTNTCCEKREEYCIDNLDSSDNYDGCTGLYEITSNSSLKKTDTNTDTTSPHVCCENRVGYCSDNTISANDFNCSPSGGSNQVLVSVSETVKCSDNNCTTSQCCVDITDKCSNNTRTSDDIICALTPGYISRTGICVDQTTGNISDTILDRSNCPINENQWIPYDDIVGTNTYDKQSKCCRLLPDADTCGTEDSGFIGSNGCNDGRGGIWNSLPAHHNSKQNVASVNLENYDQTTTQGVEDRIGACCETRVNYCKYNTTENDFNCSPRGGPNRVLKQNTDLMLSDQCTDDQGSPAECTLDRCCEDIVGMCTGNTDPSNDVDCPGNSMVNRSNYDTIPGTGVSTCCVEVNHKCGTDEGSTVPFDCSSEIKDENGVIIPHVNKTGDITCQSGGVNASCRGFELLGAFSGRSLEVHDVSGNTANICCDKITGMCSGNTNQDPDPLGDGEPDVDCSDSNKSLKNESNTIPRGNDVAANVANCCEILTGRCAGNTNSSEDIPCTEPQINRGVSVQGTTEDECCHKTGYCNGNTDPSEDFTDCGSVIGPNNTVLVMENNPADIICGTVNGCESGPNTTDQLIGCCQPITGQCSGNTYDINNVDCGNANMDEKEDYDTKVGEDTDDCCDAITGMCSGNTNQDPDTDTGEPDVDCGNANMEEKDDYATKAGVDTDDCCDIITGMCAGNTNQDPDTDTGEPDVDCSAPQINRGVSVPGTTVDDCCHITGYCDNNDISSEDYNDTKCSDLFDSNDPTLASPIFKVDPGTRVGDGWDDPISSAKIDCCDVPGSSTATNLIDPNSITNTTDEPFTNMEGFTNFKELINQDKGNMIIEGFEDTTEDQVKDKIQEDCDFIKQDMLTNLEIPESQLSFDCRLEDDKYIVDTVIIPLDGEELPSELKEKLKNGIPLTNVKRSKVKVKNNKVMGKIGKIIAIIILLIISIYLYYRYR
jgi:hypothetical protein